MDTTTQLVPMQSVRNYEGSYTVLGTSSECIIERAGLDLAMWALIVNGKHHSYHETKRAALIFCQEHPEL